MIDPKMILTVKHDDGAFTDFTNEASDLTRDNFSITPLISEKIYVGYNKPFGAMFIQMETPNSTPSTLSLQVYDGSAWVTPSLVKDETAGLSRSGFILWDKVGMTQTSIDNTPKFYCRISLASDGSAISFRGINIIFSDDSRLRANYPPINSSAFYPTGETSHILTHVATRDDIIMRLRKRYQKQNDSSDVNEMINAFDIIDIFEIREAATYLALAKIFFNMSDNDDDQWFKKYKHWNDKYNAAFETAYLSIDSNDDGIDDDEEVQAVTESPGLYR
jgi:hypothetical protein